MLGSRALRLMVLATFVFGCAAGKQTQTGGAGGSSDTTTISTSETTSSAGGSSGAAGSSHGGTATSSGGGGSGGATTSSSSGGSTGGGGSSSSGGGGSGGGTTSSTGGGAPTGTVLAFAGSDAALLGADYHPDGAWSTSQQGEGTPFRPASALLDASTGVALYGAPDGLLMFIKWSAGSFAAPLPIGNLAKTADAPAMVRFAGGAAAVYRGPDSKHYFAQYGGPMSGWSPAAEPILANNIHSFGPSAPSLAIVQGDVLVAYAGDDNNLYDQARIGGVWQGASGHGVGGTLNLTPSIIELPAGGAEAMIVYVRKSDAQVMFTLRNGGAWSAPAAVPTALTNDPVALAATADGGALIAFRGLNTMLYTCRYAAGNNPPWSAPQSFALSTAAPPALATGVGGVDVEMVFVFAGGVQHSRLSGDTWTPAEAVGGAQIKSVALSSFAP